VGHEPRVYSPRKQDGPDRLGTAGEGRAISPGHLCVGSGNDDGNLLTDNEGTSDGALIATDSREVPIPGTIAWGIVY
jgi:hypothetical protein